MCLIEVSLFDVLRFFLDVFARRPEVTHTSDPANNKQSKHDTANGDSGGWVDHGRGLMCRLQLSQKLTLQRYTFRRRLLSKLLYALFWIGYAKFNHPYRIRVVIIRVRWGREPI